MDSTDLGLREWALEVVKTLLAAEAEVNKSTDDGVTPLAAALSSNPDVAAVLREAGVTRLLPLCSTLTRLVPPFL